MIITDTIKGDGIYLRGLTISDATERYCGWLNDPEVNQFLETRNSTLEKLREYVQQKIEDPNTYFLGIFDSITDEHIGNVKLEILDKAAKRIDLGILIGSKKHWGKGLGAQATKLAIAYAFDELRMHEVELGVLGTNLRAQRTFTKAGFDVTTTTKEAVDHDGVRFDKIIMHIINKKYYART